MQGATWMRRPSPLFFWSRPPTFRKEWTGKIGMWPSFSFVLCKPLGRIEKVSCTVSDYFYLFVTSGGWYRKCNKPRNRNLWFNNVRFSPVFESCRFVSHRFSTASKLRCMTKLSDGIILHYCIACIFCKISYMKAKYIKSFYAL